MFLKGICTLLVIPAGLICCYYWYLTLVALFCIRKIKTKEAEQYIKFAIVIPAHNEEAIIGDTLHSCKNLDYPEEHYEVIVIADNCNDRTAEEAKRADAICLERFDENHKGKGFALSWAFKIVMQENYDAIVVLDADCVLDSRALMVFNQYLNEGEKVLQANDMASNPDENAMSYAVSVGNLIENELFYAPKSYLDLAVFLRGTGMVFHRSILEKYHWDAYSVVEDLEYTLKLFRDNIHIKFVNQIRVKSIFPASNKQFNVQRKRWAASLSVGKKQAFQIIKEGITQKNILLTDTGITLLVLSKPLVLLELMISCALALTCFWLYGDTSSIILLITTFTIFLMQAMYFFIGIVKLGINKNRLMFLISIPVVVLRLIIVSINGLFGSNQKLWERTPR